MVQLESRLEAFVKLGKFLRDFCENANASDTGHPLKDPWSQALEIKIGMAGQHNGWFTRDSIYFSLSKWGNLLSETSLNAWLAPYHLAPGPPKKVALIMAGNIPLVGFHDFLTVLLTGHSALVKLSSNDTVLLPFLVDFLIQVEPSLKDAVEFTDGTLNGYDAVIATGSNNTARYFEHYFGKKPNLIRKNRNSVALLTGQESPAQLEALGRDVFTYFGLGCRSVSKLLVPKTYGFDQFFEAMYGYRHVLEHLKYANNYDYNKAVYLMSEFKFLDNGFLMLKEDTHYASPIATLFYETYETLENAGRRLVRDAAKIQCVVSQAAVPGAIPFGETQNPRLTDYADGVDTVEFLLKT